MDQIISSNKTLINTNNAQYTFTIIDGKVTAVTEHIGDTSTPLPILPSDSYILDGKDVVYNSGDNFGTVSVRYTDSDGDGRFKVGSIDITDELPEGALYSPSGLYPEQIVDAQYTFTIIDDKVTAVTEHIGDTSTPLPILPSDSYILDGKDVVYNSDDNFGTVSVRYTDSDGDGRFKVGSIDIADELPEGVLHDESNLDFSNFLKVHNGEPANGELGKDLFHINEGGNLSIRDFNSSEGDSLVFDTNLGISSREELQNLVTEISYNGQDLAVDFGSENSITLVGIQPDMIGWNDVVILG